MDQFNNNYIPEPVSIQDAKEKTLKEIFNERELTIEELDKISHSVKTELLESLRYNPRTTAYLQPRSGQVNECNNPDIGDGLLRRFLINTNNIIYSLNRNSNISKPPSSF